MAFLSISESLYRALQTPFLGPIDPYRTRFCALWTDSHPCIRNSKPCASAKPGFPKGFWFWFAPMEMSPSQHIRCAAQPAPQPAPQPAQPAQPAPQPANRIWGTWKYKK